MEIKKDVFVRQFQVVPIGDYARGVSVYLLDDQNRFWVSQDNGQTWSNISLPQVAL